MMSSETTTGVHSWPCSSLSRSVKVRTPRGSSKALTSVGYSVRRPPLGRRYSVKPRFSDSAPGAVTRRRHITNRSSSCSQPPVVSGVMLTACGSANRGASPASSRAMSSVRATSRSTGIASNAGTAARAFTAYSRATGPCTARGSIGPDGVAAAAREAPASVASSSARESRRRDVDVDIRKPSMRGTKAAPARARAAAEVLIGSMRELLLILPRRGRTANDFRLSGQK